MGRFTRFYDSFDGRSQQNDAWITQRQSSVIYSSEGEQAARQGHTGLCPRGGQEARAPASSLDMVSGIGLARFRGVPEIISRAPGA